MNGYLYFCTHTIIIKQNMKDSIFSKLEKDSGFKRRYLKQTPWWKTILLLPPVCFLFIGLLGIIYLLNIDMLASLYVIPYIICFMIGTIWFKSGRRYVQKTAINKENSFLVSMAYPVDERNGYVYGAFVTDDHRHDKYYITNLCKEMDADFLEKLIGTNESAAKKKSILIEDEESGKSFYLRAYFNNEITKRNPDWREKNIFPILFIDEKYCPIIKKIDLM